MAVSMYINVTVLTDKPLTPNMGFCLIPTNFPTIWTPSGCLVIQLNSGTKLQCCCETLSLKA